MGDDGMKFRPSAAPARFPYNHPTLAEVDRRAHIAARVSGLFEIEEDVVVCNRLERAMMARGSRKLLVAIVGAWAA